MNFSNSELSLLNSSIVHTLMYNYELTEADQKKLVRMSNKIKFQMKKNNEGKERKEIHYMYMVTL